MKKLLGLLVATALFPVAANADVLKNVALKGEIQTIASDVKSNEGTGLYFRGTGARVLAGLSADLVEDVTANVLFQYANTWGSDAAAGRNMDAYWANVRLVNANVVLHNLFGCLEATVGRQFYGDEDSAVMYIGPNHYNAEINTYVPALDAAKITYADDFKAFTLIAGSMDASAGIISGTGALAPAPFVGTRWDLYGADLKLNFTDTFTAQAYFYDMRDTTVTDSHAGLYGVKANFAPEALRLSAEYARNFEGRRPLREHEDTGYMVKADLAADLGTVTARGTFYYSHPAFFAFGNFTPGLLVGHLLGGIDGYSMDGVRMWNLGADFKLADQWTVALDGFSFQSRTGHDQTLEADLTAKYAHNEYVELFAGVGYADYPSGSAFGSDNVKAQLGMLIKF